jgi:hypothetical protein
MRSVFAVLFAFVIAGCADPKEEPPVAIPGQEYFPLKTGSFIIYNVDSTRIIQNQPTEYKYQLRVTVVDSFQNAEGNITYRLQREERGNESQSWRAAGTWSAYKSVKQAVVTEGTVSYVKLAFPTSLGTGWNGNSLNDLGGEDACSNNSKCDHYVVTEMDEVLVVMQEDRDDVIMLDKRIERYSKNIGLTYKETTTLKYCTGDFCGGEENYVVDGLEYKQDIVSSGTL